jgi:hypothetical protein
MAGTWPVGWSWSMLPAEEPFGEEKERSVR